MIHGKLHVDTHEMMTPEKPRPTSMQPYRGCACSWRRTWELMGSSTSCGCRTRIMTSRAEDTLTRQDVGWVGTNHLHLRWSLHLYGKWWIIMMIARILHLTSRSNWLRNRNLYTNHKTLVSPPQFTLHLPYSCSRTPTSWWNCKSWPLMRLKRAGASRMGFSRLSKTSSICDDLTGCGQTARVAWVARPRTAAARWGGCLIWRKSTRNGWKLGPERGESFPIFLSIMSLWFCKLSGIVLKIPSTYPCILIIYFDF